MVVHSDSGFEPVFFFFQAEDGIRDHCVTGVQTCALPICLDFATGETIMELMFALNRERGTTLVMVTHDRAIAARCERRVTIEAGRVASIEEDRKSVV